jgi:hypothetical protein
MTMPITFARLQEYLDLMVRKAGGNLGVSPHRRFWTTYEALTQNPIPRPKCQGQDIFPVKFLDEKRTKVDADNSPLYVILTDSNGFCEKAQMPLGGPFLGDNNYSLTLSDGTVVKGDQVKQDIHDWLAAGARNDGTPPSAARSSQDNS